MPIDGTFGLYVYSAARFPVPLFFMLSGYTLFPYLGTPKFAQKVKKRIKRNVIITAIATAVYILADAIWARINGISFLHTFKEYLDIKTIINFLFLNDFSLSFSGNQAVHLWYMFALLYAYVALLILNKLLTKNNIKYFAIGGTALMIVLNALTLIFTIYPQYLYYPDYPLSYLFGQDNWLNHALPEVIIGIFLGGYINKKEFAIENKKPLILVLALLCLTAYFGIGMLTSNFLGCAYKSVLPIVIGEGLLFLYSKRDNIKENNVMAKIGKYLSLDIYIWHMLLVKTFYVLTQNASAFTDTWYFTYVRPLIVMIASIALAAGLYFVKKFAKGLFKKKTLNEHE